MIERIVSAFCYLLGVIGLFFVVFTVTFLSLLVLDYMGEELWTYASNEQIKEAQRNG